MNISGKVAIVTGASKGIGLALVHKLLSEGMKVAGWSRTAPDIKHENFRFYATDVKSVDSVNNSFNHTTRDFGDQIHVLINNAGLGYGGLIEEMPVDEWVEMFEVNVNGLFFCSQMVIPGMKDLVEGHIVNIASIAGTAGVEKLSGYCGSKFAVRGISQAMFKELRGYGIKVTCVNPGSVNTAFFDNIEFMTAHDNMMGSSDVADTIVHLLKTPANMLPSEIELRPLMPGGKKI